MAKYQLTELAESDLLDIAEYTYEKWGEQQWKEYQLNIEDTFNTLAENPLLGIQRNEIFPGIRSFLENKKNRHIIFYRESKTGIQILRILHHSMDITQHFDMID